MNQYIRIYLNETSEVCCMKCIRLKMVHCSLGMKSGIEYMSENRYEEDKYCNKLNKLNK